MGVMSVIKGIFSAPKVLDTGLDLAKRGADAIDAVFFTEEEKETARKDWFKEVFIPLEKVLAPQGAVRSVARRVIAQGFTKVYLFLIVAAFVVYPINPGWSQAAIELVKILSLPMSGIILFYFGSYGWGEYMKKKEEAQ